MQRQQIPEHADLVYDGSVFKVYRREQELYDGTIKPFELALRKDCVKALLVHDDSIWMLHEEQPWLSHMGLAWGEIEREEDVEMGLRREVMEETGYSIEHLHHFFSVPYHNRLRGTRYYYIARLGEKIQEPSYDGGEKITIVSYSFDQFIDYICSDESWSDLSAYLLKRYIMPNKRDELRALLFG